MNAKAVIYVRVSSKEQEREGYSIPAQLKLTKAYAEKHNLEVVKVFEEAETAKQAGRKQFRKMLNYLEDNLDCQHILIEKPDRIYRNFQDKIALQMQPGQLQLHFVKSGQIISKDSKASEKLHHDIDVAFSNYYVNNLSEEVKKGQKEKVAQGGWPGEAPLGYKNRLEDRTIQIHPTIGPLVQRTFELASTGQYTLRALADEMYHLGLRSKRAKNKLGHSRIAEMLKNPFYYSYFYWNGVLYKGSHKPLITKELFDLVQQKMSNPRKPSSTKLKLTYRGSMKCAHCGCTVTGERKRKPSGKTYIYYHCTNGKKNCENVKYLKEEDVDEQVKLALQKIQIPKDVIEWTREKLLDESLEEQNQRLAQRNQLERRYKDLDHRKSNAYDHYLDGTIDLSMWESKNKQWSKEMIEVQQQLDTIELGHESFMNRGIQLMELAREASSLFDLMTSDEKRELVHLVLSNPRLNGRTIEYDFKKPFNLFTNVVNLEEWRG